MLFRQVVTNNRTILNYNHYIISYEVILELSVKISWRKHENLNLHSFSLKRDSSLIVDSVTDIGTSDANFVDAILLTAPASK